MNFIFKDGKIEAEDFTSRLYRELNSSPQPYLVPFLKVIVKPSGTCTCTRGGGFVPREEWGSRLSQMCLKAQRPATDRLVFSSEAFLGVMRPLTLWPVCCVTRPKHRANRRLVCECDGWWGCSPGQGLGFTSIGLTPQIITEAIIVLRALQKYHFFLLRIILSR